MFLIHHCIQSCYLYLGVLVANLLRYKNIFSNKQDNKIATGCNTPPPNIPSTHTIWFLENNVTNYNLLLLAYMYKHFCKEIFVIKIRNRNIDYYQ